MSKRTKLGLTQCAFFIEKALNRMAKPLRIQVNQFGQVQCVNSFGESFLVHRDILCQVFEGKEPLIFTSRCDDGSFPQEWIIHHQDGDKFNNHPSNLVIYPNQANHMAAHRRMREGNPPKKRRPRRKHQEPPSQQDWITQLDNGDIQASDLEL